MGKAGAAAAELGMEAGNDVTILQKNYTVMCKTLGIKPDADVVESINVEGVVNHVAVDSELGPVGVRAIVEALLGRHEGLGGRYDLINTVRLWRSNAGDEGARALADYMTERAARAKSAASSPTPKPMLCYLQLMDCNVGWLGCKYLGAALASGRDKSLLTLNLNHNPCIGANGLRMLTEGMCTNCTLMRLSLAYCEIGEEGGRSIKNLLQGMGTQLEELVLTGNRLGPRGVQAFCRALGRNDKLMSLNISNNDIGPDKECLIAITDALAVNKTLLELKFNENGIGEKGGQILMDSGVLDQKKGNTTLKEFLVDVNMPMEMFEALIRAGGGAKKGKKGKGKKKK